MQVPSTPDRLRFASLLWRQLLIDRVYSTRHRSMSTSEAALDEALTYFNIQLEQGHIDEAPYGPDDIQAKFEETIRAKKGFDAEYKRRPEKAKIRYEKERINIEVVRTKDRNKLAARQQKILGDHELEEPELNKDGSPKRTQRCDLCKRSNKAGACVKRKGAIDCLYCEKRGKSSKAARKEKEKEKEKERGQAKITSVSQVAVHEDEER
ncbi:hypothetical protein P154DRAFT_616498 [Amniculicola lignicola CBS 123094]|uniref:Uncharacterized protein n=1 Tax=Amniculicola lignicola CBS 123094 TaxID=1392246 RepID=A0A6A5WWD8_9PLEO|nr:hypothetical protein P154DRAFT_616498 [Amniculicola lignicola CBS 123094]